MPDIDLTRLIEKLEAAPLSRLDQDFLVKIKATLASAASISLIQGSMLEKLYDYYCKP